MSADFSNPEKLEEVIKFSLTLEPETDRGCALMAAAYLDSQLESLLRKSFIANEDLAKALLDASNPLGTFSSRIDLAFALGHIPKLVHRDLHLIRKIRNDFGHDPKPIDFTHSPVSARCREFTHTFLDENEAPRKRFTNAVMGILAFIDMAARDQEHPKQREDLFATPEAKKWYHEAGEIVKRLFEKKQSGKS